MKTKTFIIILIGLLVISFVSVGLVTAKSDNPRNAEQPANSGRPEKLKQIIFVHPIAPDMPGKPDNPPEKPPKEPEEPKDNTYYELWGGYLNSTIEYKINPNIAMVTGGNAIEAIDAAAEAWDVKTLDVLFSNIGETEKSWYAEDRENIVSWVKFLPRDYIAVAVMWYDDDPISPTYMQIYEVDIVFNAFHNWGIEPGKRDRAFDIQNIATHEFGHPTGLNDLYYDIYSELTMYGYSSMGETKKQTLGEGDILGAQELYSVP